ncbi:MAG TPA: VanW family protein [Pseudobacteroides sp.]|uniref:VanW family protein n=1 Tax=Pseudobacteroides sp. TaxID=1968840 RepID=UPI002F944B4F
MKSLYIEPKKRVKLRIYLGKRYYTFLRYCQWYLGGNKFANSFLLSCLPYKAFCHKAPLIRKLPGVDISLQYNKVNNLRIASKRIDGIILKKSQIFSFWKLIGKPSAKKGYKEGLILNPDGSFGAGAGGGLCQLSNIIYWITLHTPLTVIQRYRHSHDIFPDTGRTQPFGSGATCVYNYIDLQILNETDNDYQLKLSMDDEFLYAEWMCEKPQNTSYEVYEKEHSIKSTYWGGYIRHNTIHRKVYNERGLMVDDEFVTENNAIMMYSPLISDN